MIGGIELGHAHRVHQTPTGRSVVKTKEANVAPNVDRKGSFGFGAREIVGKAFGLPNTLAGRIEVTQGLRQTGQGGGDSGYKFQLAQRLIARRHGERILWPTRHVSGAQAQKRRVGERHGLALRPLPGVFACRLEGEGLGQTEVAKRPGGEEIGIRLDIAHMIRPGTIDEVDSHRGIDTRRERHNEDGVSSKPT
ncbi:MAG TPA: hypothetical protein VN821_02770 [Candidatus Udaeobacter sp.]|nr:hypothetical protein [Candidatus Udaeobacter sp.]